MTRQMPSVRVSFVIPVRNAARALDRCLLSIASSVDDTVEIIVVDNGSTDDSVAVAARHGARVLAEPSRRVGGLRNAGAREAKGSILAFVDADHELAGGWLEACRNAFHDPAVGAAGRLCDPPNPGTWVQRSYACLRNRTPLMSLVDWLGAGNLAVRRDAFEQAGGFDESLEACEDVDLCRSLRSCGWHLLNVPGMGSIHYGDPERLGQVFRGELWRGRNNFRVTLRGPVSVRDLPSVLMPIALLALLVSIVPLTLALPWTGIVPLALTVLIAAGIIGLRAVVMAVRGGVRSPLQWAACVAVAASYEAGRALAPLSRASHTTRRGAAHV